MDFLAWIGEADGVTPRTRKASLITHSPITASRKASASVQKLRLSCISLKSVASMVYGLHKI